MVHVPECAAWTWDARPYPFFPELTDVWTDGPNWRLGHWLTGRFGAESLAALVRHLCLRAGMPEALIDVTGLWGAIEGYAIAALEAPRSSISTLALDTVDLSAIGGAELIPGMPVEAFLTGKSRTPLGYALRPIMFYFDRAFRDT